MIKIILKSNVACDDGAYIIDEAGRDITRELCVQTVTIHASCDKQTTATLVCNVREVEAELEASDVTYDGTRD